MNVQRVEAILRGILERPWLTLSVAGLVTLAAVVSWMRISISTDLRDVFGDAVAPASAMADLQEHFQQSNPLIVLLETAGEPADAAAAADQVAGALRREAALQDLPVRVEGDESSQSPRFVEEVMLPAAPWYLDEPALEELLARSSADHLQARIDSAVALLASPAPAAEAMARGRLADPLGVGELLAAAVQADLPAPQSVSPDGRTARLRVFLEGDPGAASRFIGLVETIAQGAVPENVTVSLTGAPAIAALSERQTKRDLIRGGALASAAVALVLAAAYRRIGAVVVVLAPAAASVAWAFGLYAWSGLPLTPLTAAGVAILAGLSVDYSIHAASAVRGASTASAGEIAAALAPVSVAMACACATTVIACAAMAASELRLLHSLALLGAIGLIATLAASLTVTPALAVVMRLATVPVRESAPRRSSMVMLPAILAAGVAAAAVAIGAAGGRPLVPFHTSTDVLHPQPNPPLQAEARMDAAFGEHGALIPILVSAPSPAALPELSAAVAQAVEASGVPGRAFGLHSLVPPRAASNGSPAPQASFWDRADPETAIAAIRAAAASAGLAPAATARGEALMRAVLSPSAPPTLEDLSRAGAPVDDFIGDTGSEILAVVFFRASEPLTDRAAQERVIGTMRRALQDVPEARLTGFAALGLETHRLVRRDFGRVTGLAAAGIVLWLLVFLRSWKRTLLVFLPVAYGLVLLLGVIALSGGAIRLDMVSIAALPLVIGIGVDDGVFLASRGGRARERVEGRTRAAGQSSIHAITTTSLTTAIAFGSLATSSMPALRTLGVVAAVGVGGAWLGAVLVLAPLLRRYAGRMAESGGTK